MRGRTREAAQIAAGENAAHLCGVTSRDAGRSWGGARDLTAEAVGGAEQGRWAPALQGAGVGWGEAGSEQGGGLPGRGMGFCTAEGSAPWRRRGDWLELPPHPARSL